MVYQTGPSISTKRTWLEHLDYHCQELTILTRASTDTISHLPVRWLRQGFLTSNPQAPDIVTRSPSVTPRWISQPSHLSGMIQHNSVNREAVNHWSSYWSMVKSQIISPKFTMNMYIYMNIWSVTQKKKNLIWWWIFRVTTLRIDFPQIMAQRDPPAGCQDAHPPGGCVFTKFSTWDVAIVLLVCNVS